MSKNSYINYYIYFFIIYTYTDFVENIGVEPMTFCVQGRRSSQLS